MQLEQGLTLSHFNLGEHQLRFIKGKTGHILLTSFVDMLSRTAGACLSCDLV